jgi:hypothetical protein
LQKNRIFWPTRRNTLFTSRTAQVFSQEFVNGLPFRFGEHAQTTARLEREPEGMETDLGM